MGVQVVSVGLRCQVPTEWFCVPTTSHVDTRKELKLIVIFSFNFFFVLAGFEVATDRCRMYGFG